MFVPTKLIGSFLALALLASPAVPVAKAAESAQERHQRLVEGAKKEGEVVIWHISNLNQKEVLDPFMRPHSEGTLLTKLTNSALC